MRTAVVEARQQFWVQQQPFDHFWVFVRGHVAPVQISIKMPQQPKKEFAVITNVFTKGGKGLYLARIINTLAVQTPSQILVQDPLSELEWGASREHL